MLRALYTGASGMSAQEMNLENVANNLANSSTAGFRKKRAIKQVPAEIHQIVHTLFSHVPPAKPEA